MVNIGLLEVLFDVITFLRIFKYIFVNFAIFNVSDNKVLWVYALNVDFLRCRNFELTHGHILCDGEVERDEPVHLIINVSVFLDRLMTILFNEM